MKSTVIDDVRPGANASAQSDFGFGAAPEARTEESLGIRWISARPEYWREASANASLSELVEPPSFLGVLGVAFGIGSMGADWIERLARSDWFAGLEPRAEDLGVARGIPAGCWRVPVGQARTTEAITATVEAFAALADFPMAPLAMIAVPGNADVAEMAVALGLVAGLRQRRDTRGCRPSVVVTVEGGASLLLSGFVRQLLEAGGFVIRSGHDTAGDHLHHFALQAIQPRKGRLVCVDLADYLACWKPGAAADLHVIPFDREAALKALSELSEARRVNINKAQALNLHFHLDSDRGGNLLMQIDQFAEHVRGLVQGSDAGIVFTTAERMDGLTGSVDLLVIHKGYVRI